MQHTRSCCSSRSGKHQDSLPKSMMASARVSYTQPGGGVSGAGVSGAGVSGAGAWGAGVEAKEGLE